MGTEKLETKLTTTPPTEVMYKRLLVHLLLSRCTQVTLFKNKVSKMRLKVTLSSSFESGSIQLST